MTNCTIYLPTYESDTIVVQRKNDDGTWSLAEFDWLGFKDYGKQTHRFRMEGLKPYVSTDQYEITIPIIKRIAKKRLLHQLSEVGLQLETDERFWHREFIGAGITEHKLIVITHKVYGKLYRDEEQNISCKVAYVYLNDCVEEFAGKMMEHSVGAWGFHSYDSELKVIDESKVIRTLTKAEARQLACKAFTENMNRWIDGYKEFVGAVKCEAYEEESE